MADKLIDKMDQKSIKNTFLPVVLLIILAAITRFIPHPFNFTAVGAMALFSGANFKDKRFAFLMPIAVMLITDLFLGFHFSICAKEKVQPKTINNVRSNCFMYILLQKYAYLDLDFTEIHKESTKIHRECIEIN